MPGELIDAREKVRKGAKPLELLRAYDRLLVGYLASLILIVAGKDLGTAMIVVAIGCIALLLGDFPVKALLASVAVCVAGVIVLVIVSPNRVQRIMAVYQECSASDLEGVCYQAIHGKYAIASGGLLGVGIGNSGEKWGYLPEAHNDFIFAIIGEETGFVGAALVILLFFVLGWSMMVIALKTYDRYISIVLICIAVWIVGQAFVNIGVVVGIFPVVGVPMPFVSAGGSSLIMCLGAAGVAISMMKEQPQIKVEARRV